MASIQPSMLPVALSHRRRLRLWHLGRLGLVAWWLGMMSATLHAQLPQRIPLGGAAQLQIQQMPVDVSQPDHVTATAVFDPPVVGVGEKTFYRVEVEAAQNSINWPEDLAAPAGLVIGTQARSQLTRLDNNRFRPLTAFVYEITPTVTGRLVMPELALVVGGQTVTLPAAPLEVTAARSAPTENTRRLRLEIAETNVFIGQPFRVRVLLPAGPGNEIQALREIQLNGAGFMTDKLATRQAVETIPHGGQTRAAFVYETVATPLTAGMLAMTVQAFTAGREFSGPISISGQVTLAGGPPRYTLLLSDPVQIAVRPLPTENELPGFTGTMGRFIAGPLQLATNRLHVGEPVHLKFSFRSEDKLARLVPPVAPRVRDWQVIADNPPDGGFTLIPLTDETSHTPVIPFCGFDPTTGRYYDLTLPAQPVTVIGDSLPTVLAALETDEAASPPMKLSGLALAPGTTASSLVPLQRHGWFVALQLAPVFGLIALWRWDERRRFLAAHPDIARRRQAKRDLRRERKRLEKAVVAGDSRNFLRHAATAMRIAVAPHFPADARALVGGDVLTSLAPASREAETVRNIFAAADRQFAAAPGETADLLALHADVCAVLQKLEEQL